MSANQTSPDSKPVVPSNDPCASGQKRPSRARRPAVLAVALASALAASSWVSAQTPAPTAVNPAKAGATPQTQPAQAAAQNPGQASKASNTQSPLGPSFSSLTPYQAEVLKPLQPVWDELGDIRKRKWIEIANRLPTLSDDEKNRVTHRMQEWASLTSEQRKQVRDNFTEAMGRSSADRQAQWEEYQKLSPEARQALIERVQQELKQRREAATGSGKAPVGAAATTRPTTRSTAAGASSATGNAGGQTGATANPPPASPAVQPTLPSPSATSTETK